MKTPKTKIGKKCLSLLLTAAMLLTTAIPSQAKMVTEDDAATQQKKERELPKNPVHHCTNKNDGTDTTDWSYVYFGSYPQMEVTGDALTSAITEASYDANGDAWVDGTKYRRISKNDTNFGGYFGDSDYRYFKWERIRWRVLSNDGSTLFVAADKGLDCKDYNEEMANITWEDCTLRNWLNNSFYHTAFSSSEQGAIVEQNVVNDDNPDYGTEGGNNTNDKVYLLSVGEVKNPVYGFCRNYDTCSVSRRLKASDYAHARGAEIDTSRDYSGNCYWWLRSPGDSTLKAAYVYYSGYCDSYGCSAQVFQHAVVPALHISLSSDLWSLTDDSSSEEGGGNGTGDEPPICTEHIWSEGVVVKSPTCTQKGEKEYTCTVCGEKKQEELKETGHTYELTGEKEYTCTICGKVIEREELPKNPVHHCTNKNDGTDTTDWSYVYFGSYPQTEVTGDALTSAITGASYDANGDAWVDGTKYHRISKGDTNNTNYFKNSDYRYFKWERIKWRVLSNDGSTLFIAADKGLDCKDYNEQYTDITWENCTLRSWLNNSFYRTAFSSSEQGAIVEQNVVNDDNPEYGTEGGNNTNDKVYLLSSKETTNPVYGFCENYDTYSVGRHLKTSDYANAMGAYINTSDEYAGNCYWLLRSPGGNTQYAAYVHYIGSFISYGINVHANDYAVVPALHINLSSNLWFLTDDGSSGEGGGNGTGDEPPICKEHTWSEGTVTKAPTCTEKGEKEYICTICGEKKREEVAKTAHTYKFTGEKEYTCIVCGEIIRKEEIPKNPVHHCTKENGDTDITDWSYIYFGSYPQTEVIGDALTSAITGASYDANGDAWVDGTKYRRISKNDTNYDGYFGDSDYRYFKWERIKWRVLSNDGSTLFVAADKGLDCKDYNEQYTDITWENCTLRRWLNNSFYRTAFSSSEQGAVVEQNVVNDDNPKYDTEGGNNTNDKVYLLSIGETTNPVYGFCENYDISSVSRCLKPSDYAHTRGTYVDTNSNYSDNCWWWLRSPGDYTRHAADVCNNGYVDSFDNHVDRSIYAVVPVLHINLSSDLWFLTDDGSSGEGGGNGIGDESPICKEHIWFEGVVTKAPTCIQKGEKEYTCTICGEKKQEELKETAHTYERTGEKEYTCTVCGKIIEREELPKNPVHHCTNKNDGTDTTDWNYVYFGSYPQTEVTGNALTSAITGASYDANGDAWVDGTKYRRISKSDTNYDGYFGDRNYRYFKWERIRWRVLSNDGNTLFVAADKGLDSKDYNEEYTDITWENCTLRSWLNNSFYHTAFSSREQGVVVEQNIVNDDNPDYGTEGGNNTTDKVYLLCIGEITNPAYGFCENYDTYSVSRRLKTSDYAHVRGVDISTSDGYVDNCRWCLRSPGVNSHFAAGVIEDGYIINLGHTVDDSFGLGAVVPALHINLSSDLWSFTDDGSSGEGGGNGTGDEPPICTEHTWSEGTVTKAPTCTEKGEKEYNCTVCGATKTEELAKTAHTYKIVLKKATTAKNGSTQEKCSACGKVKNQKTIFAVKSAAVKSSSYTYNGKKKKPSVTVKDSRGKVIGKGNYTLAYQNNIKVGKATVTIKLKGNYTGKLTKTFQIIPKGTSISGKITAKSKALTIKWKKQPKSTTGYQIQVSTNKKFAKKATVTKTVKKNSITKLTVKKLKPKKKYYVRIRTYKTVKGKNYCSNWSKAKTVTTKK